MILNKTVVAVKYFFLRKSSGFFKALYSKTFKELSTEIFSLFKVQRLKDIILWISKSNDSTKDSSTFYEFLIAFMC